MPDTVTLYLFSLFNKEGKVMVAADISVANQLPRVL